MNTVIKAIASFLAGLIGSMGFGGGGVLIIYLVIFTNTPQIKSQGINLAFFIPCAVISTVIYTIKKQIKYNEIYPVILGGCVGALFASFFLKSLKTEYLSYAFAAFLIITGILTFFTGKKEKCDKE